MTLEDLKEVQKIDTEMLFLVDDICKKYSIEYFLMYGTLLGAVRHGGPIPWDDDVDLGMTRENYIKFLSIAQKELGDDYVVKVMGSGSTDYISEIKIGRKDTVYCMPGFEKMNIMNHVQIDIFLIDKIKPMTERKFNIRNKIKKMLDIIRLNYDEKKLVILNVKKSTHKFKWCIILAVRLSHIGYLIIGEEKFEKIIYKMFVDSTGESEIYGVVLDYYSGKSRWKCSYFAKSVLMKYNERDLPVPIGYKKILSQIYGDYMAPPPECERLKKYFSEWIFKKIEKNEYSEDINK